MNYEVRNSGILIYIQETMKACIPIAIVKTQSTPWWNCSMEQNLDTCEKKSSLYPGAWS